MMSSIPSVLKINRRWFQKRDSRYENRFVSCYEKAFVNHYVRLFVVDSPLLSSYTRLCLVRATGVRMGNTHVSSQCVSPAERLLFCAQSTAHCLHEVYDKLDVIAAFNKIRMAMGEEWKTALRTRYGLYESFVMNFGLCGAPSTFWKYVNDLLLTFPLFY